MESEVIKTIVVIGGANGNKRIYSPKGFEARVKRLKYYDSYSKKLEYLLWHNEVYGAKWTSMGLIYTHKMNERGEFEEIEKSQEQIKAEAFDVLKKYIPINLIRQNMFVFECREYLTAEEIEILKKAGLE